MDYDAIVIGAGAAGMMCAARAGGRGRRVLLIEHAARLGEKIRISGGGRCNFTNLHCSPAHYLSRNPDFCRSALACYTPAHFVALVERHGIAYHEKTLGQLFCDGSARQIIAMLEAECAAGGVAWRMPCAVERVERIGAAHAAGARFRVVTAQGDVTARSLVVATGGLSVPRIGATPFGYRLAAQFGLDVVPPRPALVPLSFAPDLLERFGELAGVSLEVVVSCNGGTFREALLFTHRGLSGPAILQISSYWNGGDAIAIDLLPDLNVAAWLQEAKAARMLPVNRLAEKLPRRLAQRWCELHGDQRPLEQWSAADLRSMADGLKHWKVVPSGTLGYNKAEVTLGGVDTTGLSSKTMEAHAVPGLYFIGEVVDVTGHLGGYNFQWAWSSGHAAGEAL
jgi:predicted Rossmann fold flavoprotein